jgi:hypothetical protein
MSLSKWIMTLAVVGAAYWGGQRSILGRLPF